MTGNPLGQIDVIPVIVPLDLQTARSGDYISLKNCHGVLFVAFKGAGTDNDDPTFTLQQAQDVAGTGAKDLAIISQYFEKEGTLTSVGTWTRVTQNAATSIAPGDPSAQSQAMYAFYVDADQLDLDNGFDCVTVNSADVGTNAQLGCVFAIVTPRYPAAPQDLLSSIAD